MELTERSAEGYGSVAASPSYIAQKGMEFWPVTSHHHWTLPRACDRGNKADGVALGSTKLYEKLMKKDPTPNSTKAPSPPVTLRERCRQIADERSMKEKVVMNGEGQKGASSGAEVAPSRSQV